MAYMRQIRSYFGIGFQVERMKMSEGVPSCLGGAALPTAPLLLPPPRAQQRNAYTMLTRGRYHPGGNPGANLKSISQTIYLPLGCLQVDVKDAEHAHIPHIGPQRDVLNNP